MHTPIRHHAAGVIPEVAELRIRGNLSIGSPTVAIERPLGRRTEPHVPIETGRRVAVRRIAYAFLGKVHISPGAAEGHYPQLATAHDLDGLLEVCAGALH